MPARAKLEWLSRRIPLQPVEGAAGVYRRASKTLKAAKSGRAAQASGGRRPRVRGRKPYELTDIRELARQADAALREAICLEHGPHALDKGTRRG